MTTFQLVVSLYAVLGVTVLAILFVEDMRANPQRGLLRPLVRRLRGGSR